MRILIYGAGVIGSLYATLFSKTKLNVSIYARGSRLQTLEAKGLLYLQKGKLCRANVNVISQLNNDDIYDYIFLTVRENQLHDALKELKNNKSKTIVTMVNSLGNYDEWEKICGPNKILPAFPGAGGTIKDDILDAELTPRLIQPTTFAEVSGKKTKRIIELSRIFKQSHIPYQIVSDMHVWQMCHLAMVVPIADAYYESSDPQNAGQNWGLMKKTAKQMKQNYYWIRRHLGHLSPTKMYFFVIAPTFVLAVGLKVVFLSKFGEKFMYQHSMKASDEMQQLHRKFYEFIENYEK